jgi:ribosomal protein S27E
MGEITHYQKARQEALDRYYRDPLRCKFCGKVIDVPTHAKVSDVRGKKFCNTSCSASYNNNLKNGRKTGRKRQIYATGNCERCGIEIKNQKRSDRDEEFRKVRFCIPCRIIVGHETQLENKKAQGILTWDIISAMTKRELLAHYNGDPYKFKVKVTGHAQTIWRRSKGYLACIICGFEHINISHIKDVRAFSMDVTIGEINSPDNLIGLCPNHHWLLDRGLLDLTKLREMIT